MALSAQVALDNRMDTIANNVANLATVGYRAAAVHFESLLSDAGSDPVAFSTSGKTYISRQSGESIHTGNPLDVSVQGNGWFAIKTPAGIAYTRDGRMTMGETGELKTLNGYQVLDAGNSQLVLDPAGGTPVIARDGMITQDGKQTGAIGLFQIDNNATLSRYDNSAVLSSKPANPILDFSANGVIQGFVEGANVNPVIEMANLIKVSRTFESISQLSQTTDSSLEDAIKTLGSTSS